LPYVADLVRFRELFGIDSAHGGYALTSDVSPVLCLIFFAALPREVLDSEPTLPMISSVLSFCDMRV